MFVNLFSCFRQTSHPHRLCRPVYLYLEVFASLIFHLFLMFAKVMVATAAGWQDNVVDI